MYCKGQLVQLQADLPLIQKAGLGLAAVSYDSIAVLRDFAARRHITFPLLSDHDSKVIRAWNMVNREYPRGAQLNLANERIELYAMGDVPVYGVAYPGVFIIGPDRTVEWRLASDAAEFRITGACILARTAGVMQERSPLTAAGARVAIATTSSNTRAGLGTRLSIGLELTIPAGLHIYGPDVEGGYKGLAWNMDASRCWEVGPPVYPAPKMMHFEATGETLPIYEGTLRLRREFVVEPFLKPNDPSIYEIFCSRCLDRHRRLTPSGMLRFQTCSDRVCFPPRDIPVSWNFDFLEPDLERVPEDLRREFEIDG
ncbi:MAG TPA: redoxin domain-containing protein [Bryobacteraceae bacterium]|nr:redoxin domain-containing protein [Bryobacteraceae bacterium]